MNEEINATNETNNEVARLRQQLTRVLEIAEKFRFYTKSYEWLTMKNELDKIKAEHEARLSAAPEEPTHEGITMDEWYGGFSKIESTEPAPEWRELGPGEEIHTGDEVQAKHHDKINGKWQAAWSFEIGVKAGHFKAMRYRTRRPLPKQEEERPLLKVMEYCRKWADEHLAGHGKETFYARLGLLVDFATDFYSDEIQKLKEAK